MRMGVLVMVSIYRQSFNLFLSCRQFCEVSYEHLYSPKYNTIGNIMPLYSVVLHLN